MQASFSSSLSVRTVIQYAVLAGVAYILAGAPFLSIVTPYSGVSPQSASVQSSANVDRLDSLVIPEANLSCSKHSLNGISVLSREPLVVYIEGFLSDWEAKELVRLR
jgi:prolyl 4-hydroxylase